MKRLYCDDQSQQLNCGFHVQEKGGDLVPNDSLRNLSVYLTLQKAEQAGFKASDYGLDDEKSAVIAAVFSKYDTNDDFVLSTYEVNQLL